MGEGLAGGWLRGEVGWGCRWEGRRGDSGALLHAAALLTAHISENPLTEAGEVGGRGWAWIHSGISLLTERRTTGSPFRHSALPILLHSLQGLRELAAPGHRVQEEREDKRRSKRRREQKRKQESHCRTRTPRFQDERGEYTFPAD